MTVTTHISFSLTHKILYHSRPVLLTAVGKLIKDRQQVFKGRSPGKSLESFKTNPIIVKGPSSSHVARPRNQDTHLVIHSPPISSQNSSLTSSTTSADKYWNTAMKKSALINNMHSTKIGDESRASIQSSTESLQGFVLRR